MKNNKRFLIIMFMFVLVMNVKIYASATDGSFKSDDGSITINLGLQQGSNEYYQGYDMSVTNNTNKDINGWEFRFTIPNSNADINAIWGMDKRCENKDEKLIVTMTGKDYAYVIPANGTVSGVGFTLNPGNITFENIAVKGNNSNSNSNAATPETIPETSEVNNQVEQNNEGSNANGNNNQVPVIESNNVIVNNFAGKLSVSGTDIVDSGGNTMILQGVSTHGLQHTNGRNTAFKDYVNIDNFRELRDNWGINVVRLAVYTEENGYLGGSKQSMDVAIQNGVEYAKELGLYIILDWHILSDGNPLTHLEEAKNFFANYATKYAGCDNVIFEICNEPNGGSDDGMWQDVKNYATQIIPIIRNAGSDALICVGTPCWSQRVDIAANNPIRENEVGGQGNGLARNVLYSIHFYAATHYDSVMNNVVNAHAKGLPIFCTEFGVCSADGNGSIDFDNTAKWLGLFNDYHISRICWSYSNCNEAAALIKPDCEKVSGISGEELSEAGKWICNYYSGMKGNAKIENPNRQNNAIQESKEAKPDENNIKKETLKENNTDKKITSETKPQSNNDKNDKKDNSGNSRKELFDKWKMFIKAWKWIVKVSVKSFLT